MKKIKAYQPKTGQACGCKKGVQRDNCPSCEGTGMMVDFKAIRETTRRPAAPPLTAAPAAAHADAPSVPHTPTPWNIHPVKQIVDGRKETFLTANATVVASARSMKDAAFIVRAVNAYERHTKALARIMSINGSSGGSVSLVKEFKAIAEQALDSYDVQAVAQAEEK